MLKLEERRLTQTFSRMQPETVSVSAESESEETPSWKLTADLSDAPHFKLELYYSVTPGRKNQAKLSQTATRQGPISFVTTKQPLHKHSFSLFLRPTCRT